MAYQADRQGSVRLFYIDDSGSVDTGYATFSWLEFPIEKWNLALEDILAWRKSIRQAHGIPVEKEIHASKFVNGRGDPSLDPTWNRFKINRRQVVDAAFRFMLQAQWLSVGTIYSSSKLKRRHFALERVRVYGQLVSIFDKRLSDKGERGLIVIDGGGGDKSYMFAHRQLSLNTRSIIEDPVFFDSKQSQFIQLADLIAYAAYQSLLKNPNKRFAWDWYGSLAGKDIFGGPLEV